MSLALKRTLGMVVAILVIVGGIGAWKYHSIAALRQRMASMKYPPVAVATTEAVESAWQRKIHAVGTFAAIEGVTVANQLEGEVALIAFESGRHAKAGDLLVQLDISTDEAQLRGLEAQADLARITLQRARELQEAKTNSQADLDAADAQYREALSAVDNMRATIGKKTIRAPFAGLLGIRLVNLGQVVPVGSPIVSLQSLDPIYVNFTVPQQDVGNLRVGQAVQLTVDAFPGTVFNGTINAVNSKVDESTRNIQAQATVANPGERLVPGMFAGVDVVLPESDRLITLPETAIVYNPYGNAVYVVEKTSDASGADLLVARQHFVQLGATRGDQIAIVKGVKAGDEVVTTGQIKLRNGAPVQINNSVVPSNSPAPTPPNT